MCVLIFISFVANDISILFANRSAVLYHQSQYDEALTEIERAIKSKYPKEIMYKLKERKARCLLAKKDLNAALTAFRETVQALDDSNIPLERKLKLEMDAQIMIKMLQKNLEMESKIRKNKNVATGTKDTPINKKKVAEDFVSDALEFDYTEDEGRFAKAATDIKLGTFLVQEKPHVSCLLQSYAQTHCQSCFKRTIVPIACINCADIIYCSEKCRDDAKDSFHKYECGVLQHLWNSGASITCQMALRIIAQKSLKYFLDIKDDLNDLKTNLDYSKTHDLPNDDYRSVFILVTHEKDRTFDDIFHRNLMATFLNYCLKVGGFYEDNESEDDFNYIGQLLYHNLQFLQFNAHEISELQYKGKNDVGTSTFIGGGLYPTVAFFNHSCDPGVVRYFRGNTVMLRTIKKISKGSMVAENYGPIFTQMPKEERQSKLLNQYHFQCMCQPCMANWPTFKEMDDTILRFRCEGMNKTCKNVLLVPIETNEFMIKCTECGESTNIMKGLKSLQDTDMLFKTATRLLESGDNKNALSKFVETLDLFDQSLVPPFRSYHLTQQGIRRCIIEYGNKVIL